MSNFLEVSDDDITQLNDADLRSLIGLLCEADYRLAGLSTKGVTWGGHQDARDGGLDVVVRGETLPPINSFVPRTITGFQVKKPDMPRAEIIKEMKPKGILREEIKALICEKGAYIIVSSGSSTANTALRNRIAAMKEAVAGESKHQDLYLDFLDRNRIASWVRSHPFLVLWVHNKIGRPLRGWHPYKNWANAPDGLDDEYFCDDGLRLHERTARINNGMSIIDGLKKIRTELSVPNTSIRLVGLSGVGKTRLVQALFDEKIGENALNCSLAFYTDMSDCPDPDPLQMVEQIAAAKTRAILIVDNCPPDLHRRLTRVCRDVKSTISLLTVEYDIREDIPEETSVFMLEPARKEIIEKLILRRFPHIGQVDAGTVAGFSGGNARIAIALANTMKKGETLSGFHDEELFERLFRQRQDPNVTLLRSAEVCSLVYSFEGTDVDSEKSELNFLASIIGRSGSELYRDVVDLKERDLIQARGVWRAVLPQAISHRLAKRALTLMPNDKLISYFFNQGSKRLIISFSRRLGYLHDCIYAIETVNRLLDYDGWLGKENCSFNSLGMNVFRNIAPVSPEIILAVMERAAKGENQRAFISKTNGHCYEFTALLRRLAYDSALFERSTELMCRFALIEDKDENNNSAKALLKSLFYIYLSGTHAPVDARAKVIMGLVNAEDPNKQDLGLLLLGAALETRYFSSFFDFEFGARPRDYGYQPRSQEEVVQWYETFISLCTQLALSDQSIAQKARKLLADKFRGLWTDAEMYEALENASVQIHKKKSWNDGWLAIRGIIWYDRKSFREEILIKLNGLENLLRPKDLFERAHAIVLSDQHQPFALEDELEDDLDVSSGLKRVEASAQSIGSQVAQNMDVLSDLLPELVTSTNTRLFSFGKGLAEGCADKYVIWKILYTQLQITPSDKWQFAVLLGFLAFCAETDKEFYSLILDSMIDDDLLGEWFPLFQMTFTIDKQGINRIIKSLDSNKVNIGTLRNLAWGRNHESIGDDDLANLMRRILSKEEGISIVIEILGMRFHKSEKESHLHSDALLTVARTVLSSFSFPRNEKQYPSLDYKLALIANVCLLGPEGIKTAEEICLHLSDAINNYRIYPNEYSMLLSSLACTQPIVFLNVFIRGDEKHNFRQIGMFSDASSSPGNPLNNISEDHLVSWCEFSPSIRYPLIISAIPVFSETSNSGELTWSPFIFTMFEKAPDLDIILERLADAIMPEVWSGSRANLLQKRSNLLKTLQLHENTKIRSWAIYQHSNLEATIQKLRKFEMQERSESDESFE